jgi:hypothetical protein
MSNNSEEGADGSSMGSDWDVCRVIPREDFVKSFLRAEVRVNVSLCMECLPQLVILGEPSLDLVSWEAVVDISLASATIASVATNTFPEALLYGRDERVMAREIEAREGDICSHKAAGERGGVVRLWSCNLLILYLGLPEVVGDLSLEVATWCNLWISPDDGAIAVFEGPVALWRSDKISGKKWEKRTFQAGVP